MEMSLISLQIIRILIISLTIDPITEVHNDAWLMWVTSGLDPNNRQTTVQNDES